MKWKAAVAAFVVLSLVGAGCGGSDRLTRAQFTKQADAICASAKERIERRKPGQNGLVELFMAYQRAKIAGIGKLNPPAELEARNAEYLDVLKARGALLTRYAPAVRRRRAPESAYVESRELQTREEELASALHLDRCVDNGGRKEA